MVLGTIVIAYSKTAMVNCINTHFGIDADILSLFEHEFVESKSLSNPHSLEDKQVLAYAEQNVKLVDGYY